MMLARIETSKSGARCLIVYCSMALNNYNEAIAEAEAKLNPKGEPMAVIAYPVGIGNDYKEIGRAINIMARQKISERKVGTR